jgi:hypothetical protein
MYNIEEYESVIGLVLTIVDKFEPNLHLRGNTPDWFVIAAAVSCNVEVSDVVNKLTKARDEYFGIDKEQQNS